MEYSLEFTIAGLYRASSPIGLFEGLEYYSGSKHRVYYPKDKSIISKLNIGKKLNITLTTDKLTETLS